MMAFASSRSWRPVFVCLLGLFSLTSAQEVCSTTTLRDSDQKVDAFFKDVCKSFELDGDLTLEAITWSNNSIQGTRTLPLGALETITGSLMLNGINTDDGSSWTLEGDNLIEVDLNLTFSQLENFLVPRFRDLTTASSVVFRDVSAASASVDFPKLWPRLWTVTHMEVTDTSLTSFGPFNPIFNVASGYDAYITASGNSQLQSLHIDGWSTQNLMVHAYIKDNHEEINVDFPDITLAMLNVSGVQTLSIPSVTALGSAYFDSETQAISSNGFSTLDLSNVTTAYGTLDISNNPHLMTLSLGNLNTVTSLRITNNSALREIDLSNLEAVSTSLYLDGPIDSLVAPIAKGLVGDVTIRTSGSFDCNSLEITQTTGTPNCTNTPPAMGGGGERPDGPGDGDDNDDGSGSSDDSGNDSGGLSQGAQIGIGIGVGIGVLAIASAILFWCCARRSKRRSPRNAGASEYYISEPKGIERSPARYTKVANSGSVDHSSESPESQFGNSPTSQYDNTGIIDIRYTGGHGHGGAGGWNGGKGWSPPEQGVQSVELEEQQGVRHEMDARSLNDMELDDEREETRSLEDIERAHGQR